MVFKNNWHCEKKESQSELYKLCAVAMEIPSALIARVSWAITATTNWQ